MTEAIEWLQNNPKALIAGNRFDQPGLALSFIQHLYRLGAKEIVIEQESVRIHDNNAPYTDTFIVVLPNEPEKRARLFAVYNQEAQEYGESFGGEQPQMETITEEEAEEPGDPEAEGELSYVDEPLADIGQITLTFWWD